MNHSPKGAQPRFLTAIKGTLTPIYVLKLSSDPSITTVPGPPGFPSDPCAISDASAAHTRGFRHAVEFRTSRKADSHRFTINRVGLRYRSSRFRVAQRQALMDWVEEGLSPSSARHSRTSQRYPACSYSDFLRFGEPQRGVSPVAMYVCSLAIC